MTKLLSSWQKKKRRNPAKASDFSETEKAAYVSQPEPIRSFNIFHRTCKTCPLQAFIDAYSNADFSGIGTGEGVSEAWQEILFEWATLLRSEQSEYILESSKQIAALEARITFIEYSAHYLGIQWDEDIANEFIKEGYDPHNLPMAISLAKRLVFDLTELREEYERLTKTTNGKPKTEDEWMEDVAMLSKFQGYSINPENITVQKYAAIFNLFLKQNKAQQDNG